MNMLVSIVVHVALAFIALYFIEKRQRSAAGNPGTPRPESLKRENSEHSKTEGKENSGVGEPAGTAQLNSKAAPFKLVQETRKPFGLVIANGCKYDPNACEFVPKPVFNPEAQIFSPFLTKS